MNISEQLIEKADRLQDRIVEKLDRESIKKSVVNAAEDIFDTPDMKIINSMIDKALKMGKDEEDVVQIVINMMRSE